MTQRFQFCKTSYLYQAISLIAAYSLGLSCHYLALCGIMHWTIFLRYLLLNRSLCPDLTFLRQCSKGLSFVASINLATWVSVSKESKYSKEPCVVPVSYYRISPIFLQFWWVLYYIFRLLSPIFLYFWTPKALDTLQTVWESRYRQLSVIGRQSIRRDWGR